MNCIIVHGTNAKDKDNVKKFGLPPQNKRHWMPWLKNELEKRGIKTDTPLMPKNWDPKYEEWKKELEKLNVDEKTILIGHSAGGGFLVRWLGDTQRKIKKLILVAPAIITKERDYEKFEELIKFDVDEEVNNLTEETVIFVSDNESKGIKRAVEIYRNALQGKVIELKNKKHFLEHNMGTKEFPELLQEVLK